MYMNKTCRKCNETKSIDQFNLAKRNADGYCNHCKVCDRIHRQHYYQLNKDKIRAWSLANPEKFKESKRKYAARPEIIIKRREWKRTADKKYLANPINRVNNNMRGNMYHALKTKKAFRKWESLAGYTLEDLIKHITPLLVNGMTWDNYGEWHIDHIKPKSLFKYQSTDDPQFKECWSLANLQPLWKIDNIKKGNKFIG